MYRPPSHADKGRGAGQAGELWGILGYFSLRYKCLTH